MSNSYLETIKAVDGELFNMSYHQTRYESVLKELGVSEIKDLEEFLNPPQFGIYRCRLVYTSESITVSYHEYKKRDISSLKLIFNNDIEYSMKSTCRDEVDSLFAQRGEGDDILIIKDLLVSDTSIANIAFYKEGSWITPRTPLLKGTTRARLLDEGKITEADIKVQDLRTFSQVALLNAMIDFDILDRCEFLI
ncbi:aminotransferase class IV family protein [Sulfurimonas sp.]|uniref:aminotransferase class IV family protein n=1 Tax=Sulfurimonas sp. TaxID=2022749 RepID=UPI002615B42E|nr:aminotransferase class IV family protein [Sulfurimonas sp.]MCW8896372.1 aminotransferase class IV family protein [Sulfurimonas sp.]MCW9067215.1 aminotransferase class IV family protein [Sulfurimonas sp.]